MDKTLDLVAKILAIVGAINWGLVGVGYFVGTNLNLVNLALGSIPVLENIVYILVGIAGILLLIPMLKK